MRVFWAHGYAGTSVRQLCGAMGLQTGSFYATFGSKAGLFVRVLARYVSTMQLGQPGEQALRGYFDRAIAGRQPRGCLLVLAAQQRDLLEPDSQAIVTAGLRGLEDFFCRCLGAREDARDQARHLTATATGLMVLHRAGAAPDHLRSIADHALSFLDIGRPLG